MLIALAAEHGLKIHQLNAVTAFLQGKLNEEIYMPQPEGFEDGSEKVLKFKIPIYGLKQANFNWNVMLTQSLKSAGLEGSKLNPCIYYDPDTILAI